MTLTYTLEKTLPRVVYISDDCTVSESKEQIIVTEPNGTKHFFPKGSFVFSQRGVCDLDKW